MCSAHNKQRSNYENLEMYRAHDSAYKDWYQWYLGAVQLISNILPLPNSFRNRFCHLIRPNWIFTHATQQLKKKKNTSQEWSVAIVLLLKYNNRIKREKKTFYYLLQLHSVHRFGALCTLFKHTFKNINKSFQRLCWNYDGKG